MDDSQPPSTASLLESSLEQAIARLARVTPTAETKRLLLESRRLRGLMANWRSIPPSPDVRREMLARVMSVSASAAAASAVISIAPPSPPGPVALASPPPRELHRAITQPSVAAVVRVPAAATVPAPPDPSSSPTASLAPGVALVRREGLELETLDGVPGIELRFPPTTPGARVRGVLVTLRPGAELPARVLPSGEVFLVVEGSATIGEHALKAGDVSHSDPGAEVPPIRSDAGCVLFLAAPADEQGA